MPPILPAISLQRDDTDIGVLQSDICSKPHLGRGPRMSQRVVADVGVNAELGQRVRHRADAAPNRVPSSAACIVILTLSTRTLAAAAVAERSEHDTLNSRLSYRPGRGATCTG